MHICNRSLRGTGKINLYTVLGTQEFNRTFGKSFNKRKELTKSRLQRVCKQQVDEGACSRKGRWSAPLDAGADMDNMYWTTPLHPLPLQAPVL